MYVSPHHSYTYTFVQALVSQLKCKQIRVVLQRFGKSSLLRIEVLCYKRTELSFHAYIDVFIDNACYETLL